jgi:U4/U6 small nuclear ribonucleoprotein PRP31
VEDLEYQLIVDCNALSVDIDSEITIVHSFIRDKYKLKLPLLESRIQHPIDYARIVKKIGNEVDLTRVDLKGLLPSPDNVDYNDRINN